MPLRETAADSGVRNYAPGCERLPLRYDIWHDDGCDHQDVKVGHEVRWLSKIEAQGEASKKKDEGHSVRADRPDAVLSELAIARSKDCRKGADEPKSRLRPQRRLGRVSGEAAGCVDGGEWRTGMDPRARL